MRLEVAFFDPICPVCKARAKQVVEDQIFLNNHVRTIEHPTEDTFWLFIDDDMGNVVRKILEKRLEDILGPDDFEFYR